MDGVALAVAILLGLPLLTLAVPVGATFRFEGVETLRGELMFDWLFGWVRVRRRLPGDAAAPQPATATARPRSRSTSRGGGRRALAVLGQAPFRRRVYRLVQDLVAAAHLTLRLDMRLGLGDPADTGRLWAIVGPLTAMAQNLRSVQLRIEPEFMDPVLEFEAEGRMRLVPLQFVALAIAFALSPASIRAWLTLLRGRG